MPGQSSRSQPTPRQQEVLDLLLRGATNKQIAGRLGITERGVKYHVSLLLTYYAVGSRAELISLLLRRRR